MLGGKLALLAALGLLMAGCTAPARPVPTAEVERASVPAVPAVPEGVSLEPSCPDPLAIADVERLPASEATLAAPPRTPALGEELRLWSWCARELPPLFVAHFAVRLHAETRCEFGAYGTRSTSGHHFAMVGTHDGQPVHFGAGGGGLSFGAHALLVDSDTLVAEVFGEGRGATVVAEARAWPAGEHAFTFVFVEAEAWENDLTGDQAGGWYLACEEPFVLEAIEGSHEGFVTTLASADGGVGARAPFAAVSVADGLERIFEAPTVDAWGIGVRGTAVVDVAHDGGQATWTFLPGDDVQWEHEQAGPGPLAVRVTGATVLGTVLLVGAGHGPVASLEALGAIHDA